MTSLPAGISSLRFLLGRRKAHGIDDFVVQRRPGCDRVFSSNKLSNQRRIFSSSAWHCIWHMKITLLSL